MEHSSKGMYTVGEFYIMEIAEKTPGFLLSQE
jgi:hypothetical protein